MGVGALEVPSSERKRLAALYVFSDNCVSVCHRSFPCANAQDQGIGFARAATSQI